MKIGLIGNNISFSNAPDIHTHLAKIFKIKLDINFGLKQIHILGGYDEGTGKRHI